MPISLHLSHVTLAAALDTIESKTSYTFIYDASKVNVNQVVSIDTESHQLMDILNLLLKETNIIYTVVGQQVILSRAEAILLLRQEKKQLTGVVVDSNDLPIIGANVWEKESNNGTVTNLDGEFSLTVSPQSPLTVSYIGYQSKEVDHTGKYQIRIELIENSLALDEVVVTALGIEKRESTLPYSTQQIHADDITKVKNLNMINSLIGRTAGIQINQSSSGLGGSSKVIIRGNRSVSGNNQPLYVIDGVPMINTSTEQPFSILGGTADAGNRDGGDGISNLNPEDIESMTILKGAASTALYGSKAANGVILITTRRGTPGERKITFSSNLTAETATKLPLFQNNYGRASGTSHSWGEKEILPQHNNLESYFNRGLTAIHALTFSTGNDRAQTYVSYANTAAKGITDNNTLDKNNLNLHELLNFFDDRLTLEVNANILVQKNKNKPTAGGYYMNPLVGLYSFPRGMDITPYKKQFETYDEERNMPVQNWYTNITDYEQNPFWLSKRIQSVDKRNRAITGATLGYRLTDWLSFQVRGNLDIIYDKFQQKIYASTSPGIAGKNGRYIDMTYEEKFLFGDLLAMVKKRWNRFSVNGFLGVGLSDTRYSLLRLDSKTASLYYPNVFTVTNIIMSSSAYIKEENDARSQYQSLFGSLQLGFNDYLFLDLSARNDWSSTLAYTADKKKGFFYPAIGFSWVMNRSLPLPEWISLGKIRASWSKVGNDIPLFASNPVAHIGAGGLPIPNDTAPFGDLKPEMSNSIEVGTEWSFFNRRVEFDFTYYKTNTKNQLFTLPSSAGADYKYYNVNSGNIQNRGIEIMLRGTPLLTTHWSWKSSLNYSMNRNRVLTLHDELPVFVYGNEGFSSSYSMRLVEGGSFGDIYGKAFARDEKSQIIYDDNNLPMVVGNGNTIKVGNCNPDFLLGWGNRLTYKNLTLDFLIDGRFGGKVLLQTQALLDQIGVSKVTGEVRDLGYVELEGHRIDDIQGFYERVGGRNGVTEYYMYDATNIRLRELSLSYTFPSSWLEKSRLISNLQLSLVGRNLFYLYNNAPFDPDVTLSTSNDNQGVEVFGLPAVRSIGAYLKIEF